MEWTRTPLAAVAGLAMTSAASAIMFDEVDVEAWVGEGENEALMIIDWTDGRQLAFGYRWGLLETATGLDMMEAVSGTIDGLFREWVPGLEEQAIFGLGWDLDGDGFDIADPDDWHEEGWFENGYWGYYTATDGLDWGFAPTGLDQRTLSDGDWDGWSWAPDFVGGPPIVPLVPGPGAAVLLAGLGCRSRRRRS